MTSYPAWAYQPLKSYLDVSYFYRTLPGRTHEQRVLLNQITGTLSTRYAPTDEKSLAAQASQRTWLEMYNNLERAKPEFYSDYIGYYNSEKKHNALGLFQYGEDYLIAGGNNRLCMWKFAHKESVFVDVEVHAYDEELAYYWRTLSDLGVSIERLDEKATDPRGHWLLRLGQLLITCENRSHVLAFTNYYVELKRPKPIHILIEKFVRRWNVRKIDCWQLFWHAGITERTPWVIRDFQDYITSYRFFGLNNNSV